MPSKVDLERGAETVRRLQEELERQGDDSHQDKLHALLSLLESPVFSQILQLQSNVKKLKKKIHDDDFDPENINFMNLSDNEGRSSSSSDSDDDSISDFTTIEEFIAKASQGRETEMIELYKTEAEGLGFSVVGLRSENRGDLGIFVQDIKPGGVADRQGGLKERDQILVIDGQALAPSISHQEAIGILQQVKGTVKLVVARGGIPQTQGTLSSVSPQVSRTPSAVSSLSQTSGNLPDTKWAEVETIELHNDGCGLGFGIVGGQATGGVVVKTIVDGGAAQKNGRLRSGDHILRISDTDVREMSSEQAAQILRQCGTIVKLIVARGALDDIADKNDFIETKESDANDAHSSDSEVESKTTADTLHDGDMNYFDVVIEKDSKGLGITIAGFVDSEYDETDDESSSSKIYIKSVLPGSAASKDGRIRPRDQIVAVDGRSLLDPHITSDDAVNVLRSTGQVVKLTISRPRKPQDMTTTDMQSESSSSSSSDTEVVESHQEEEEDRPIDYTLPLSDDTEARIKQEWSYRVGNEYEIVVAQIKKFSESSGLGISLEGTVDMSDHPHHYVRSILHDGPVGINGTLRPGDELLEVNGHPLLGLHHFEVVVVMKDLPIGVVMVCARPLDALFKAQARDSVVLEEFDGEFHRVPESDIAEETEGQTSQTQTSSEDEEMPSATDERSTDGEYDETTTDVHETSMKETSMSEAVTSMSEAVTSEVSTSDSSTEEVEDEDTETEEVAKDAAWRDEVHFVELNKTEKGLGFSILDFQDPVYPDKTALLIRSLVQGGESDSSGKINPGDKLVSVNQVSLEGSNLETAVTVLKALPKGFVVLGLKKPKSMYQVEAAQTMEQTQDDEFLSSEEEVETNESHHVHEPSPAPSPHVSRTFNVEPSVSSSSSEDEEQGDSSTTVPSVSSVIAAFNKGQQPTHPLTRQSPTEELSTTGSVSVSEASTSDVSSRPPSSHGTTNTEPRLQESSNTDRDMKVKQISVAGMTAIAITSSNMRPQPRQPSPLPQQQQRVPSPAVHVQPTMVPMRQSSRQKNSAPSWQDSGPVHSKPFPEEGYERIVHIEKGNTSLGVTVSPDRDGDGLVIRSILTGGAISRTGEPQVGDIIRRVNSDSAVGLGAMQARSLIRNHSMHSARVKIVYIPKANIHAYKNGLPPVEDLTSLKPSHSNASDHESIASIKSKFEHTDEKPVQPVQPSYQAKPRSVQPASVKRTSPISDPEPNHNLWAPAKRIEIRRSAGISLGISIVGGVNKTKAGSKPQDIYIKDVIPTSTVGIDGRIKPGDRILKVDGTDLIGATHADAVEAIRNSGNPVVLWVQSYLGSGEVEQKQVEEVPKVGRTPAEIEEIYRSYPGQLHIIDLFKGPKGLGLSLAGNKESPDQGIFVVGVNPEGAAGKDGRIQVGDEICEINGVPLNGPNNHQTAISVISSAKSKLQIVLVRPDRAQSPEPVKPASEQPAVRVIKLVKDFQGLGFAIKETSSGIVVQSIASGGTADRDGQLKKGDYIIAVNQHTLKDVSYEMAINILKSTKGVVSLTVASNPQGPGAAQEEDALTCPIVDGEELTIEIIKGKSGLGLSIVGGSDSLLNSILVHTVYDNGAAAKDGRLWPGDQILRVNNKDLHNATHEEAIEALRHTPSRVRLTVLRDTNRDSIGISDNRVEYIDVVLHKPPGRGLGLSIVGKRDDVGVFISDVVKGGAAHNEGSLLKGDQIIAVDDFNIENANQKEAAEVLKNIGDTVKLKIARAHALSGGAVTSLLSPLATLERSRSSSIKSEGGKNIRFVEIEKTPTHPLGISISGGIGSPLGDVPVFVAMVQEHGVAKGQLNIGDKILSINGQTTDYKTHEEVVNMLRGSADAIVLMKVQEGDEEIMKLSNFLAETASAMDAIVDSNNKEDARSLSRQASANESVDLSKCVDVSIQRAQNGLGFSIVGGIESTYGDLPIFVKSISQGGAAEQSVLKKGDQIVAVNGELLTNATHEEALATLKKASGKITIRIIPS